MMPGIPSMMAPQPPSKQQIDMLTKPSWEQVISLMRDNAHRNYHIDIETDSTIAASIDGDMQGISEMLKAVGATMQLLTPLVQSGMMPVDAAKELMLSVTRRGRIGLAMEDALEKMQAPQPHQDPALQVAQIKAQADQQKAQQQAQQDAQSKQMDLMLEQKRMQMEAEFEQRRSENDMRVAQAEQAYQAQQDQLQQRMEHEREMQRQAFEQQAEQMRMMLEQRLAALEQQTTLSKAQMDNATKIEVAEIAAQTTLDAAQMSAAKQAESSNAE
jgi:DNA polymerase III alpha subunit (gram-positive type)